MEVAHKLFFKEIFISHLVFAELILTALSLTSDSELKVRTITCDGTTVNISTLNKLGCNIYK